MRRLLLVLVFLPLLAFADILLTVRGVVHDPQHRPVANATVTLKALRSQFTRSVQTNAAGEFTLTAVPIGEYSVEADASGFKPAVEAMTLVSGASPILHLQLGVAELTQTATVTASAEGGEAESFTPTTLISHADITTTPGAEQANSMAMVTDFTPGAYLTHDMLHMRGGHQTDWLIDGVELPQLNIASNLAPQIDPKNINYLEVLRGSYGAEYGDRTYGEFDVVPRSGFESNGAAELIATAGNFGTTDDQLSYGNHTERFAWYGSLSGNRSGLGLETPVAQVYHDADNGQGAFTSMLFNRDPADQFRFDAQWERAYYQIPYDPDPNDFENQQFQTAGLRDHETEGDSFLIFSWVHTFSPNAVLTLSPFYHRNNSVYASPLSDTPIATSQGLLSDYGGGQASLSLHLPKNDIEAGVYAYAAAQSENFGLNFNDGSGTAPLRERDHVSGDETALYASDSYRPFASLVLTAGVRYTRFAAGVTENTANPRLGASYTLPGLGWTLHGFWGRYYQPPPLITLSGPLLQYIASLSSGGNPTSFAPLSGERDEEHQVGVTIPWRGWQIDFDNFDTRAVNFLDHNNIGESDIFIPVTTAQARITGSEVTLATPQLMHRLRLHGSYSNQIAESQGGFTGGLIVGSPSGSGWGLLDHDQRNTANLGGTLALPARIQAASNVYYGSGFSNAYGPAAHLPGHADIDLALSRPFGENLTASVDALNLLDRHLLIDDSLTFGGFHWDNPREVYAQLTWRFKP